MALPTTQVSVSVSATQTSPIDLGTSTFPLSVLRGVSTTDGTGAGQADRIFTDTRTLTASSTEDLDLAGVLTDAFGATITFARIKAILVAAAAANTNNVIVGGVASGLSAGPILPQTTGTVTLRPGGGFVVWCGGADATGYTVTAGTADLLHIANSAGGTSVTYDIVIIGASA